MVRALAMAGVVVMNYHGYLIIRGARREGGWAYDLFDPWTGPLSTRFAATFVLTAGVGVTLMTASSLGDADKTREMRWRLVRRGLLLYGGGLLFDMIWPGTILPYYGAMFVIAAAMFTLRSRWIISIGVAAAVAGWSIRWWRFERELSGNSTEWLTRPGPRSPRGLLFDVFVNGTHPLLPWLVFLSAGIVIGRSLTTSWWRPVATAIGVVSYTVGSILGASATDRRWVTVLSDDPFERGIAYTASALGTALLAFAGISWLADRFRQTRPIGMLQRAGQLSLTIYLAHAFVFNLVVGSTDVFDGRGLPTALVSAVLFWLAATGLAVAYQQRFGRGPVETVYRRLTA